MIDMAELLDILKQQHELMIKMSKLQEVIFLLLTEDIDKEEMPATVYLSGKPIQ